MNVALNLKPVKCIPSKKTYTSWVLSIGKEPKLQSIAAFQSGLDLGGRGEGGELMLLVRLKVKSQTNILESNAVTVKTLSTHLHKILLELHFA